jgi:hypothetical protein
MKSLFNKTEREGLKRVFIQFSGKTGKVNLSIPTEGERQKAEVDEAEFVFLFHAYRVRPNFSTQKSVNSDYIANLGQDVKVTVDGQTFTGAWSEVRPKVGNDCDLNLCLFGLIQISEGVFEACEMQLQRTSWQAWSDQKIATQIDGLEGVPILSISKGEEVEGKKGAYILPSFQAREMTDDEKSVIYPEIGEGVEKGGEAFESLKNFAQNVLKV